MPVLLSFIFWKQDQLLRYLTGIKMIMVQNSQTFISVEQVWIIYSTDTQMPDVPWGVRLLCPEGSLCQLEHRRTSSSSVCQSHDCVASPLLAFSAFMSESSHLSGSSLALHHSVMDGSVVTPPLLHRLWHGWCPTAAVLLRAPCRFVCVTQRCKFAEVTNYSTRSCEEKQQ